MNYEKDFLAKIDDLTKRYKLSTERKFALSVEAGAICFLLEANDADYRMLEEFANAPPLGTAHIAIMAKGAIADLRSRGIDANNATEYFTDKLAALGEELKSRA